MSDFHRLWGYGPWGIFGPRYMLTPEEEETKKTARRLFDKYFEDWIDGLPFNAGTVEIGWSDFLSDLRGFPALAFVPGGMSEFPPLFYVILARDVPVEVVRELLQVNPEAVRKKEADHRWTIFQWIQWASLDSINPEVVRLILELFPESVIEQRHATVPENPLEFFMENDPQSDVVRVIHETSPYAVAFSLAHHLTGHHVLTEHVLDYVLGRASNFESRNQSVFSLKFEDYHREASRTLIKDMVKNLESTNRDVFYRYLQAYVVGRRAYLEGKEEYLDSYFDETSLTCCVLYCIANWDSGDLNKTEFWSKYVAAFRDDLTKSSDKGATPLLCALRMGYQWNPVIQDIVKEDPSAVIGTVNKLHQLYPFQVAALPSGKEHYYSIGHYSSEEYEKCNSINNSFELLRLHAAAMPTAPRTDTRPKKKMKL